MLAIQIRDYNAKDFFVKKSSALPKKLLKIGMHKVCRQKVAVQSTAALCALSARKDIKNERAHF